MSTRSLIAVKQDDGTVKSIYCHWDGYPDNNGRLLLGFYNTRELADALLELGALSSLDERLAPEPGENHSYDSPASGICVAYHRDRDEEYRPPAVWDSPEHIIHDASDCTWAEYVYLFQDGAWYVDKTYHPEGWRLVADVLAEEDAK